MPHRVRLIAAFAAAVLIFSQGCAREEEKKMPAKDGSFSDFAGRVTGESQVFTPQESKKSPAEEPALEERDLKVGILGPKTGEESEIGRFTFEGAELAAKVFNGSGGVDGRPVEEVPIDSQGDPKATQEGVSRLTSQKVLAIIGSPTGWSTFTPVFASNESRTIFISAGTRRHIGTSGAYVFRMSLPIEKAAGDILDYTVNKEGLKEYFMVTVMEDEALNVAGAFRRIAEAKGAHIKGDGSIFTENDIPGAVADLEARMPVDAVIFAGNPSAAVAFSKLARKKGIKVPIIGGEELHNNEFLKGGASVAGSIVYTGFTADDTNPATKKFIESFKKATGRPPTSFAADAYDSFMIVAKAVKESGSTNPEKVRDAIANTRDFEGVTGTINMDEKREAVRAPYLLKVEKSSNSYKFSIVQSPHSK